MTVIGAAHKRPEHQDSANLDLARRVEALARVLANPAAAIRRLARRLAALPPECLPSTDSAPDRTRRWPHGKGECWSAIFLHDDAIRALERPHACPPPEPG